MTADKINVKPARNPFAPDRPPMRTYEVCYRLGDTHPTVRRIDAAWWETDGDSRIGIDQPVYDFVTFKDPDGKKVFSVRRGLVEYIEEIRDTPDERRAFQDIIDGDPYKTETGTAWDEGKILRAVLRGKLAIDSARVLLGYEPFHLPETLFAFTYEQCPNGCDGVKTGCSDCPPPNDA